MLAVKLQLCFFPFLCREPVRFDKIKVPDTLALKRSNFVQFCAERIHIFIYFIGIFRSSHTDNRSHIMRKALQFLAPPSFSFSLFAVSSFALYEKINFSF